MDIKEIKEILRLVKRYSLQEFSLQRGEDRISITRGLPTAEVSPPPVRVDAVPEMPAAAATLPEQAADKGQETLSVGDNQFLVTSPIVGTFYRAPSPESPPYVEGGSQVSKGAVLCIVEAMKIMNEIECEVNGRISAVLVENAQPVEYGQPLFIIDLT